MDIKNTDWKGYSIDEIRLRRMVNLAKMEIDKHKIAQITSPLVNKTKATANSPIWHKLLGALDFVDYAVLAFSLGSKVFKLFRRR